MTDAQEDSFQQSGFLSPMVEDVAAIRAEFSEWFKLLARCNRLGMRMVAAIEMPLGSPARTIQAALFFRTLQSFQAAILLAERGMLADARSALRACAESTILHERLAADAGFTELMGENADYYRRVMAKMLLTNPRTRELFSPQEVADIEQEVSTIEERYAPRLPGKITLANELKSPKAASIYNMVYRQMSLDAAHPTLNALCRHIEESTRLMTFGPQQHDMVNTLGGLIQVMGFLIASVGKSFDVPNADDLGKDLLTLLTNFAQLREVSGKQQQAPPSDT
jgi:hypothetical protein